MHACAIMQMPYSCSGYQALPSIGNSMSKLACSLDTPRYKLTPERAIPLIKWFEDHKDHPYPTRHEKLLLCQSTQLTYTQVCPVIKFDHDTPIIIILNCWGSVCDLFVVNKLLTKLHWGFPHNALHSPNYYYNNNNYYYYHACSL